MKTGTQTFTISGREYTGAYCRPTDDLDPAAIAALKRHYNVHFAVAEGGLFIPNAAKEAIAEEIRAFKAAQCVRIDISDPRLDEQGGGWLAKEVMELLANGRRNRWAGEQWLDYRAMMQRRLAGETVPAGRADEFVALLNAGKSRAEIRAWVDANLD